MLNSNKLMALAFCLSTIIFVNVSKASEQILATISTDAQSDSFQLAVNSDEENQTLTSFYIDNFSSGQFLGRDELSMKTFIKEGIDLPHKGKINFAKIIGENFDEEQGGVIVIDTLYNILTGKRKSYELHLAKDKSGWKLFKAGQIITQIKALANKVPLVGVVGAKDLVMK
ncbi:MAG: hypothetical protein PHY93_00400 [Bacteriovorax sp.]|nr:hypothetical protein [Bacteriovorax sp.]